jgi:hypothetical protein
LLAGSILAGGTSLAAFSLRSEPNAPPSREANARSLSDGASKVQPSNRTETDAARLAASWLVRRQRADGLFRYGLLPEFAADLPGDNPLRQAGAALALVEFGRLRRGSSDPGERTLAEEALRRGERAAAALMTRAFAIGAGAPRPTLPEDEVNPVGLAGILLVTMACHPTPADETSRSVDALATFLLRRQRPDGSLRLRADRSDDDDEPDAMDFYPGEALAGLARVARFSGDQAAGAAVDRALDVYRRHFRERPTPAFVPWQSLAYAERHVTRPDSSSAEFVREMIDWLLPLQYRAGDRSVPSDWLGGFAGWGDGRSWNTPPDITTASMAEALVAGLMVIRDADAAERRADYRAALSRSLAFLRQLQFVPSRVRHFEPSFAAELVGGFHGGLTDGTLRIDYTQHALVAFLGAAGAGVS